MGESNPFDTAYRQLEALVAHVTVAFGWMEVDRDDDSGQVTLYNGQSYLDFRVTPDEEVDSISERAAGAFSEREFNDND
jgi:hypothetical protein